MLNATLMTSRQIYNCLDQLLKNADLVVRITAAEALQHGKTLEVTMSDVNVKVTGHVAVISYIRLVQKHDGQAYKLTKASETRVWEKKNGTWKMIHFHRSDVQRV